MDNEKPESQRLTRWRTPLAREKASVARRQSTRTGHKVMMLCSNCNCSFEEYESRRRGLLKFCSDDCKIDWQKNT